MTVYWQYFMSVSLSVVYTSFSDNPFAYLKTNGTCDRSKFVVVVVLLKNIRQYFGSFAEILFFLKNDGGY